MDVPELVDLASVAKENGKDVNDVVGAAFKAGLKPRVPKTDDRPALFDRNEVFAAMIAAKCYPLIRGVPSQSAN